MSDYEDASVLDSGVIGSLLSDDECDIGFVYNIESYNFRLPDCLLIISPFLDEARELMRKQATEKVVYSEIKVLIVCINVAFEVMEKVKIIPDELSCVILQWFNDSQSKFIAYLRRHASDLVVSEQMSGRNDRRRFSSSDVTVTVSGSSSRDMKDGRDTSKTNKEPPSTEYILLSEAQGVITIADEQRKFGFFDTALRNYRTAVMFLKVLKCFVRPKYGYEATAAFETALMRFSECNDLLGSFMREHFSKNCTDVYDISMENTLGKGNYGSVYICKNKKSGLKYACKIMKLKRVSSYYIRKFQAEIDALRGVHHPNIVQLYEVFFSGDAIHIILEICSGGEVFSYLAAKSNQGFPEAHAALLMRDMLFAVNYLHSKGIIHRDLKLENFLFSLNSTESHLKLIDFGLARRVGKEEVIFHDVGSAYYTAPEVISSYYDSRCDIWSLGVIAFMLIYGAPPFTGNTCEKIRENILEKDLVFPKRSYKVSGVTTDFISRLMEKNQEDRLTIAEALRHPFIELAANYKSRAKLDVMSRSPAMPLPNWHVLSGIVHYLVERPGQKLMQLALAFHLPSKVIGECVDDFYSLDLDRSGVILVSRLRQCVQLEMEGEFEFVRTPKSSSLSAEEALGILNKFENLKLSFWDFLAAVFLEKYRVTEGDVCFAFDYLDYHRQQSIDTNALLSVFGHQAKGYNIDAIISEMDIDGDGKINLNDWMTYWKRIEVDETVPQPKSNPVSSFFNMFRRSLNIGPHRIQNNNNGGVASPSSSILSSNALNAKQHSPLAQHPFGFPLA